MENAREIKVERKHVKADQWYVAIAEVVNRPTAVVTDFRSMLSSWFLV